MSGGTSAPVRVSLSQAGIEALGRIRSERTALLGARIARLSEEQRVALITALPALERGDGGDPTEVLSRLREMVRRLESRAGDTRTPTVIDTESASDDELFDVLDRFGSSERRPTP